MRFFLKGPYPDYRVPSRPSITQYLHKNYIDAKKRAHLSDKRQEVALTADIWKSKTLDAYLLVTSQYVDKQWELQNTYLTLREVNDHKTGVNITKALLEVVAEFRLEGYSCLLTDNAANV
jgi:hypothetical protein